MRISAALLVVSLLSIAWSYKQPLLGPIAALNRQRYLVSTASAAQLYRSASALHAKKRTNITKKLREPNFADKEEEEELELEEEKRDDAVQEPIVSAYESDVRIQIGSSIRDSAETREAPPQSTATRTTPPSSKQRVPSSSTMGIFADLEKDLESFDKRSKLVDYQSNVARVDEKNKAENNSIANKAKNVFSTILIADFFVVLVFLVWFLAAAALQSTYPVVLERFQDIFQPVVVPSLTVLMVGSIASGVLDKSEGRT